MSRIPPAEWAPQRALFLGFPSDPDLWKDDLASAQAEVAALARRLSDTVAVRLVASGSKAAATARAMVHAGVLVDDIAFGDIWLRDTGPLFTGAARCARFRFNGWRGKYLMERDT
jgi:agmatine deiminase